MFRIPEAEIRCVEPICTDPLQPHTHQNTLQKTYLSLNMYRCIIYLCRSVIILPFLQIWQPLCGTPPLFSAAKCSTSQVICQQLLFSSFTTPLHDLLWPNNILNVNQHDRNYILHHIHSPSQINWIKHGHEIGYFDTSKYGTHTPKLVLAPGAIFRENTGRIR